MKINKNQTGAIGIVELVLLLVVVLIIGFAGWKVLDTKNKSYNSSESQQEISEVLPLPANLDELLSLDKINEIVESEGAGKKLSDIELKNNDGTLVYEVKLSDGKVLVINALNGAVIGTEDDDEEDDEKLPANFKLGISFAKAIGVAKEVYPNGQVRKIELEVEDGVLVISVRFVDGSRVDVNAENGQVARKKAPKKDKEDKKSEDQRGSSKDSDKDAEDEFEDDGDDDINDDENENENEDEDEDSDDDSDVDENDNE